MAVVAYVPVESNVPGFFVIPGFTLYGANYKGEIVNTKTWHLKKRFRIRGYPALTVMSDTEGVMKWMFVHRLVALAFHGPQPLDKPLVNHKDNSKDNCHPDNLEWTDYTGNIVHAYQTGQRSDNRPILAKNLLDGTVERFQTSNDCARRFGVTGERIWRNVRDNTGNVYFDHFVFRYEDDERPWPDLTASDVGKRNNGDPCSVLAKEIRTGNITQAGSATKLGEVLGVSASTITYALRTNRQYPCLGYLFKRQTDPAPWIL